MMQESNFDSVVDQIVEHDSRFQRDAYFFLRDALGHTQKLIRKGGKNIVRHVSGQELLDGIRDYALSQFGPMTTTVFEEWGIKTCEDFGEIVFNMVANNLLAKTDKDTREDFKNGYSFAEVFKNPYLPASKIHKYFQTPIFF